MLCSKIVDLLNQEQRWRPTDRATVEDVDRLVGKTLVAATLYFQELWKNTLTDAERHLLKRILQGEPPQPEDQPRGLRLNNTPVM